ncbi:hypothetical protein [Pseudomonas viridiflava]|uniref:hypothetical protein n=1 Tax=Pseudomonas viridiflava TaxID=33069 RepID=UPI000F01E9ED|nr:hypothetical protein [Pseudomonas viridiflava]
MKLVTKPIKSEDENICGAKFSYSGSPSGVEVATSSQTLTFSATDGREYPGEVSGLFALGAGVGTATVQLDYQTAIYFSVYELQGVEGQEDDNTSVSVILLKGSSPIFTKSYSLKEQDVSGAYIDTRETGTYSGGGFDITMPTKRQDTYASTVKSKEPHNLDCRIEMAGLSSGASSIVASLKLTFASEDKSATFTTSELQNLLPALTEYEGKKDFMYVDDKGNVTAGVGFMLADANAAASFPFLDFNDNPASDDQKRAEWQKILSLYSEKHTADWYEDYTSLYLSDDFIDSKLQDIVKSNFNPLKTVFPEFGSFPSAARIAIHDMYYNLGEAGLLKFKNLMAAIGRRDWAGAAAESHRLDINEKRNDYVRDLFLLAAKPD